MMQKVFGFRPPPDRIYNDLLAIRKIALKLRTDQATAHLNFDYFSRRNSQINANWIKNRKSMLLKLLTNFETRLAKRRNILSTRLKTELNRFHCRRMGQFDRLLTKYTRCKRLVEEINAKEKTDFTKHKRDFKMRGDVPKLRMKVERVEPKPAPRKFALFGSLSDIEILPNDINLTETIRDRATSKTIMSLVQTILTEQEGLKFERRMTRAFTRQNTLTSMVEIGEESEDSLSWLKNPGL